MRTIQKQQRGSENSSEPDLFQTATLTSGVSATCEEETLRDSSSAISSPGLEGGVTLLNSLAGQQIALSGLGLVPANRFRVSANAAAKLTRGISGRNSIVSLPSATLTQSLVNRLRARMALSGSTEYRLTWKNSITPSHRSICRLRASTCRKSASAFSGWPTLTARDSRTLKGGKDRPGKTGGPSLLQLLLRMGFSEGYLNPDFARWLMDYPPSHLQCAAMATQSFRKSQRSSSKHSSKQQPEN